MEAALSAAVADRVILPFNDSGKKVNDGGVGSKDGAGDMLAAQHRPPMPMMNSSALDQFVGNGTVNAAEIDRTSLMAATGAQSQAAVKAEPSALASAGSESEKRNPLRRGKWTSEEEAYANRLIQEFKAGLLPLTDGTTLRTFLSKLLNCDPMRISKKYVGSNCIGKQVFRRCSAHVNSLVPDEIERTRFELSELEKKFLDRVAQNKSSKGGGSGAASKSSRVGGEMSSSRGGGGMGNKMNKSAAAVGRALLLGSNAPQAQGSHGSADIDGAGGLLAQLQAQNRGMFDNNTAGSFLSGGSQQGGLGKIRCAFMSEFSVHVVPSSRITSPLIFILSFPGNTSNNASLTNLMLQTGMSRNQISLLAGKGISSSASLANMLGKQRSFDRLMSLDFQSMQSIDNLANLIQAGMPNSGRVPKAQMKNMEWGTQWTGAPAPGLLSYGGGAKGSIENLVRVLSGNNRLGDTNNVNSHANATNFSNFVQGATQQGNNLAGGAPTNNLTNFIQSLTQQQHNQQQDNSVNYSNIIQNMASGDVGGNSLLQNNNANIASGANQNLGGSNDLMNMLNQSASSAGHFSQQQSFNPFMQQLNPQFGGPSQGNPMMQFLAQAGE
jgi:hypothetical protein